MSCARFRIWRNSPVPSFSRSVFSMAFIWATRRSSPLPRGTPQPQAAPQSSSRSIRTRPACLRPEKTPPRLLTATEHKIALIRDLGVEHLLVVNFDARLRGHASGGIRSPAGHTRQAVAGDLRRTRVVLRKESRRQSDASAEARGRTSFQRGRHPAGDGQRHGRKQHGDSASGGRGVSREGRGNARPRIHDSRDSGSRRAARPAAWIPDRQSERAQRAISSQRRLCGGGKARRRPPARGGESRPPPERRGGESKRLLELHLFDLDRDIYGEEVEVRFTRYLRPEQKFDSLEELKAQIARDVQQARSAG